MTKANEIRPDRVAPQSQTTGLHEAEAQKVKQQQAQKITSEDAARVAQQAGFVRTTKAKKRGIDIGDSSHAPIPLPDDDSDNDAEIWTQERLDGAQESLSLAGTEFGEIAKADQVDTPMAETLIGSSFLPTEDGVEELEELSKRSPPEPIPLEEVSSNVKKLFNINLDESVPVGHKVLATGLVVAGEGESVHVDKGGLSEKHLASGVQRVTERSNQAVGEAQRMSKGINKELNVRRTFVFKR